MKPQTRQILLHLEAGHTLTAMQALKRFGCFRLAPRILELRDAGYNVHRRLIRRDRKRFARYQLVGGRPAGSGRLPASGMRA